MSLSSCEKCYENPCICGHMYKHHGAEELRELIKVLVGLAVKKEQGFEFKAPGHLLRAQRLNSGRYLVIVDTGNRAMPFVMSEYKSGATEWDSGTYSAVLESLNEKFDEKVKQLSVFI